MTEEILDIPIKETALYNSHVQLGAKLVPFSGYKMPVSYSNGIQSEYFAVRDEVGIFDVSHMGEFTIDGSGAMQINSSGGAIGIGNDDIDQAINIGTQGERTISIGQAHLQILLLSVMLRGQLLLLLLLELDI